MEEDGSVGRREDEVVPGPEEDGVEDVPGGEEERGVDVEEGLGLLLVLRGGTLLVLGGGTLVELLLLLVLLLLLLLLVVWGADVEVVLSTGGSDVVVSVAGGGEVPPVVVELVSSRFASCTMEVARGAFARWTASIALCSDSNTPSWNRPGKYRWRSSWRDAGDADFSMSANDSDVAVAVCWSAAPIWQRTRGAPAEASPKRTSMHKISAMTVRRRYAIFLAGFGLCRLAFVDCIPEAVFSRTPTGRRVSGEGELLPLRKSMVEVGLDLSGNDVVVPKLWEIRRLSMQEAVAADSESVGEWLICSQSADCLLTVGPSLSRKQDQAR
jgi:hypothetical protein